MCSKYKLAPHGSYNSNMWVSEGLKSNSTRVRAIVVSKQGSNY